MKFSCDGACVYRHYNVDGELLYVGTSGNPFVRLQDHRIGSHWFKSFAWIELEHYSSADEAMVAETRAIKEERPRYNGKLRDWGRKLTDPQVADIRRRYGRGETAASLAREFGVGAGYVAQLVAHKYRKWVT